VITHSCDPNTQKVEIRGLRVLGQPELHRETLSQKTKTTKKGNPAVLTESTELISMKGNSSKKTNLKKI
jgi:hypothetical protein